MTTFELNIQNEIQKLGNTEKIKYIILCRVVKYNQFFATLVKTPNSLWFANRTL